MVTAVGGNRSRNQRVLLMDLLVGGVQPVAAGRKVEPEIPSPKSADKRQSCRRITAPKCVADLAAQGFQGLRRQRPALRREFQPEVLGHTHVCPLVIQVPHARHIGQAKVFDPVADGVIGHVGGVVPPGNVAVAPQILEYMAAAAGITPVGRDFAGALGAGSKHHGRFVIIGHPGVVGQRFEHQGVSDDRLRRCVSVGRIDQPHRSPGCRIVNKVAALLCQSHQVLRIGGGGGQGQLQRLRQRIKNPVEPVDRQCAGLVTRPLLAIPWRKTRAAVPAALWRPGRGRLHRPNP